MISLSNIRFQSRMVCTLSHKEKGSVNHSPHLLGHVKSCQLKLRSNCTELKNRNASFNRFRIDASSTNFVLASTQKANPGEKKGFVEEMRFVAMRLHTKDQAPKEGKSEPKPEEKPMAQWQPTREGYLQFLSESKAVYQAMEDIMMRASNDSYKAFQGTGLERSAALEKDIAWFKETYDLEPAELAEDGCGRQYAKLLVRLAEDDPPAFICHFYNVYFAHSAGGRMIGKKMSESLISGAELEFYQYGGAELKELLDGVRDALNLTAESWTREQKDHCLEETEMSFKYSGQILRTIFGA